MTSPGGSSMDYGDDYVAARLSIDVPSEGIGQIRELTEGVDRFRTAMESAVRAEADMSRYITEMGEASRKASEYQANLVEQMTQMISLQGHMNSAPPSMGVPGGGFQQPFQGMTHGTGAGPVTPGSRPPSPSDVVWQLQGAAGQQAGAHGVVNMAASRGVAGSMVNLSPESVNSLASAIASREHAARTQDHETGSGKNPSGGGGGGGGGQRKPSAPDPFDRVGKGISEAGNLAGSVIHEIGASQGLGAARMGAAGLDFARKKVEAHQQKKTDRSGGDGGDGGGGGDGSGDDSSADDSGGGIGKLAKSLGIAGSVLTAGAALFDVFQSGGQMVQGWRNISEARGGAAGEGAQLALRTRADASNPYLTTDQARQINQAMVSEGYSDATGTPMGQQGGSAKEFMTKNITDHNMSVAQSVEMLRFAADGTKVSIGELASSLNTIKEISKNGGPLSQSADDMQREMMSQASSLSGQGVTPESALRTGMLSAVAFNGDPVLQGSMASMNSSMGGTMEERLHGGEGGTALKLPGNLTPNAMKRFMHDNDPDNKAMYNSLQWAAKKFKKDFGDTIGYDDGGPKGANWVKATERFYTYIQANYPSSDAAQDEQKAIALYQKFAWDGVTPQQIVSENKKTVDDATAGDRQVGDRKSGYGGADKGKKTYGSNTLDRIVNAYGSEKDVQVIKDDGSTEDLDVTNQDQVKKLNDGSYKWKHKGDRGRGISISETPGTIGKDFSTDYPWASAGGDGKNPDSPSGSTANPKGAVSGSVTIDLTPEAKKIFQVAGGHNPVPLTPNDIAANGGQGNAQKNNPPAGNSPVTRYGGWK